MRVITRKDGTVHHASLPLYIRAWPSSLRLRSQIYCSNLLKIFTQPRSSLTRGIHDPCGPSSTAGVTGPLAVTDRPEISL